MTWDDVHDAREVFLACVRALSSPGQLITGIACRRDVTDPAQAYGLAVVESLLDPDVSVHADGVDLPAGLSTVADIADISEADFVLTSSCATTALPRLKRGSSIHPEDSATLINVTPAHTPSRLFELSGPGLPEPRLTPLPLPGEFAAVWASVNGAYPRGVDLFLTTDDGLIALPRTTRVTLSEED